jgi:hypothetical protein
MAGAVRWCSPDGTDLWEVDGNPGEHLSRMAAPPRRPQSLVRRRVIRNLWPCSVAARGSSPDRDLHRRDGSPSEGKAPR